MRLARAGTDAEGMRPFCPTWTEEQRRLRAEWLHTCDERAILESFAGFGSDDIHADLPRIAVPTLLITAGRGEVVTAAEQAELQALLPSLKTARVADAGHMIPWDDEEGFYAAFGSFLGTPLVA
jgi:N-formylmaleamate deformylase